MSFVHGKGGYIEVGGQSITAYMKSTKLGRDGSTSKVTPFGSNSESYIAGLKDGKLSVSGTFDPTVHDILAPMLATEQAWVYGPQGNGSTKPKISGNGIVTKYDMDQSVESEIKISLEIQVSGDVTEGTFS